MVRLRAISGRPGFGASTLTPRAFDGPRKPSGYLAGFGLPPPLNAGLEWSPACPGWGVGASAPLGTTGSGSGGTAGNGAYSRIVREGDIIIIPTMVAHGWSQIKDHVTYLSVRPDPERALPSGYVYPLLLKNLPTPPPKQ